MPSSPDEKTGRSAARSDRGHQPAAVRRTEPEPVGGAEPLTFPDGPRLELDQLLAQLVERAREVLGTQGRLRGLLRANQAVIGDLTLPVVLRRIAEAARELVGARYAALGVISPDGGLAEFVHVGMSAGTVERIGHLPQGKGLLGALIDDPHPIRLDRIADDPRSAGFPPGHPPMSSFLGVPIRIRDAVFGNLYLAESTRGGFTDEDEQLTRSLAATAAVAIENSRLYETARTRGEWLAASATITRQVLAVNAEASAAAVGPLQLIADRTREVAHADLVSVLLPVAGPGDHGPEADELQVAVAVGAGAQIVHGLRVPREGSLSGQVFSTGEPRRIAAADELGFVVAASGELEVGPVLAVPLAGSARLHGVLSVARLRGRPVFTAEDTEMTAGFANHAAIAIELAQARAEQQRAALLDDRERIAADLHDHVIQRLFATGLGLQSLAVSVGPGPSRDRLMSSVADLDATISQIRNSIFQLHQQPQAAAQGLRARLLQVAGDEAEALGFEPAVQFSGLIDTLPDDVAEDLLAVLREALSNIGRHARARTAEVRLSAERQQVTLQVRDDGVGLAPTGRRSGLANLRRRAERRGGTFTLGPRDPCGTCLTWTIPHT
jgi:two-component system, NarL family, sensor histidine kinase DevS